MIERYTREPMRSLWSSEKTFELWLQVEIAVCEAWGLTGLIPDSDLEIIRKASFNPEKYAQKFAETKHDLIAFTHAVAEDLGSAGRWIHHGLTSNDVKDTALALQLRDSIDLLGGDLKKLKKTLKQHALQYKATICIGRSHGMHAEPMSFGHKFALWHAEFSRHGMRLRALRQRVAVCKLSGPVGSYSSVPPIVERDVANRLKLTPILANQVIQRDIHAEYTQVLALIMASLEKIATEIRHLQRNEVGEVQEPFGKPGFVTKGSSSMPHKRNPELCERICGLARVVRANATVAVENIALWHERDISHSSAERIILPDSSLATDYACHLMTLIVGGLEVDLERIKHNLELSFGAVFAPRLMLALVTHGMRRTKAYDIAQTLACKAVEDKTDLRILASKNKQVSLTLESSEIEELFDYRWFIRHIDTQFKNLGWRL